MEHQYSRKISRKRKKKKILRAFVIFIYRCICLGLATAAVILGIHVYRWIEGVKTEEMLLEGYPESLIDLMERNPETEGFVKNYLKNKDRELVIDLSGEVTEGEIPLFLQWDERWGYEKYGSDFMAVTGCGPTCLSMVRCGLSGDGEWHPLKVAGMAQEQGYYVDGAGSSWELMAGGAERIGLKVHSVIFDAAHIEAELKNNRPVICIMGPGDFTSSGHFIVLTEIDGEGKIMVCDPNSVKNSEKTWDMEKLIPQIRNLWSYSYEG